MISAYRHGPHPQPARPRGITGHTGTPRIPLRTGRPGPQPHSARTARAVLAWNTETKRVVNQFLCDAKNPARQRHFQQAFAAEEHDWSDNALTRQWEEQPFPSYDPRHGNVYDVQLVHADRTPTGYYGRKFGEAWVYIRAHGDLHVLEYAVVNPRTGTLITFTPEAALDPRSRVYMPEDAIIRNTMATTGVIGKYMERGFYGLAGAMVLAPVAVVVAEGIGCGVVFTGLRVIGTQMLKQFTWSTFGTKVGTDLAVQGLAGTLNNGADFKKTLSEINYTGSLVAFLLPGSGWGAAGRNSVLKATFKTNVVMDEQWHPHFKLQLPQLNSMTGFAKYMTDIGTDMVSTMVKAKFITGATPAARWASQAVQRTGTTVGRWIASQRVTLGTLGTIGASVVAKAAKDDEKKRIVKRIEPVKP